MQTSCKLVQRCLNVILSFHISFKSDPLSCIFLQLSWTGSLSLLPFRDTVVYSERERTNKMWTCLLFLEIARVTHSYTHTYTEANKKRGINCTDAEHSWLKKILSYETKSAAFKWKAHGVRFMQNRSRRHHFATSDAFVNTFYQFPI